jgi:3-oxoacyl-[acyl-carrier protein] reductase
MKAIITGCSKGIGKEILRKLLNDGCEVISISRTKTVLDDLTIKIGTNWKEIIGNILDEDVHSKIISVLSEWKSLDILINNAGYLISKPFEELNYTEVKNSFDVNYYGPFKISQLCLPYLKRSAKASLINIGSIGGVQGSVKFPGLSAYSSSKGALAILTECLAEEYKDTSIHFNCLALGAVQTEMLAKAFPGYQAPFSPKQMAGYIINFIENSSEMMNGKIISVSASTP